MDQSPVSPISVSVRDAAKMIGLGKSRLYELINDGTIRSTTIGGRRLVLVSSLRELVGEAA